MKWLTNIDEAKEESLKSLKPIQLQFEIAGVFGEKQFLKKFNDTIMDDPVDIVNLEMKVPTVQGLSEKAPAYMKFELTSTKMEEIKNHTEKIRSLIKENELILINESK